MRFYHGTTKNRLPRIFKEGLKPRAEKGSILIFENENKHMKGVALTKSFKYATMWASRKAYTYSGEPVVLELDYPYELREGYEKGRKNIKNG